MKKRLLKLLTCATLCWTTTFAHAITIVAKFDASITNDANAAAIIAGVNAAIQNLQTNLTDTLTVNILFKSDESIGLGQSLTYYGTYSYASYLTALRARATSPNDLLALSTIPNSVNDPLANTNKIQINLPLARLMGLTTSTGVSNTDSTISLKTSLMNFTRTNLDPNKYDLIATAEHEINEVLGIPSNVGDASGVISPVDLFRYTTNLVRTWTTNGDDAYLSIDGTNLLARFNQDPGGDYGDFWSKNGTWSPPGKPAIGQVQDAFGGPGVFQDDGPNELTILDVIGYTLANTPPPSPPTLSIVPAGANQVTLSWSNSYTGFVLQERTGFVTPTWANSTSAGANPVTVPTTGAQKYFRLIKTPPPVPSLKPAAVADGPASEPTLRLSVHVTRPRKP